MACCEEIDAGRRKAFPAARRCIECQRRLERQRRRKWTSN
ncbi:TraR/DksA C4-type zinc finger protein [Staphylococcus aureus]